MVPNLNRKLYRKRHNTDIKKEKRDLRKTYKKERKRSWVKLKKQNQKKNLKLRSMSKIIPMVSNENSENKGKMKEIVVKDDEENFVIGTRKERN